MQCFLSSKSDGKRYGRNSEGERERETVIHNRLNVHQLARILTRVGVATFICDPLILRTKLLATETVGDFSHVHMFATLQIVHAHISRLMLQDPRTTELLPTMLRALLDCTK